MYKSVNLKEKLHRELLQLSDSGLISSISAFVSEAVDNELNRMSPSRNKQSEIIALKESAENCLHAVQEMQIVKSDLESLEKKILKQSQRGGIPELIKLAKETEHLNILRPELREKILQELISTLDNTGVGDEVVITIKINGGQLK